jgi:hypothetical protein
MAGLIRKYQCAIAVLSINQMAFEETLVSLVENLEILWLMTKNSKHQAEKIFSRDLPADRFISFLEEVSEGYRRQGWLAGSQQNTEAAKR